MDRFSATRDSLHRLAEYVMAPASYEVIGYIGLRVSPGGFKTQEFDGRVLAVEGTALTDGSTRVELDGATLNSVARPFDVVATSDTVYAAVTPFEPDMPLVVDATAAFEIAGWYALAQEALVALTRDEQEATAIQLWPEHFDLGTSFDDVNYGASPGDAAVDEPYLYVGPWDIEASKAKHPEAFNASFGVVATRADIKDADAALAFFERTRAQLA